MILPHGCVRRNSTKDCVDTSVEITGIINSVIQKTKRLTFGATLIVFLVKEKNFLLTELKKVESVMNSINKYLTKVLTYRHNVTQPHHKTKSHTKSHNNITTNITSKNQITQPLHIPTSHNYLYHIHLIENK